MTPPAFTAPTFKACVLQVVPELDTGGVEQTVVDVSEAIIAAGGRSIVVSKGGRLAERLITGGAMVVAMPVHSKNPFVQYANYMRLKTLIRAERVDIVHVRSRAPAMAAIGAARACGIKSVATYHGIYNAKTKLKLWYNSQMTRADITIANSDYTRAHILSTYPDLPPARVISIPRGIDIERLDPAIVDAQRIGKLTESWNLNAVSGHTRFLLAARLTRWKGQALIIEAAHLLKIQGISAFQILMAGDDQGRTEYTQSLKAQIEAYGLGDTVKLVGHCADMAAAYALCDFALVPSLEPEAFGRTAVEPQAMQRPPLASNQGATVETVIPGETGWLVPHGEPQAWADAMREAMNLPQTGRADMGQKGRARVKALFSLDVMCARTLDVYRELLLS